MKGIDIEPNHPLVRLYLGVALLLESRHAEAIAQMELAVSLMGDASTAMGQLAHAHAVSGNRADAQRLLKTLLVQAEHRPVDYYTVALAYVGLGEWESAFQWLEKARENRGVGSLALLVKGDPRMDILRPDPRFRQLMQDMALED